jgi:hypothetical protein
VASDRYYHGGARDLNPGDLVLSAAETGAHSVSGAGGAPYRRDRVYLTGTPGEARAYAALHIPEEALAAIAVGRRVSVADLGGDVYEVEPVGEVRPDRDYDGAPGRSWEAPRARVVCVLERRVPPRAA